MLQQPREGHYPAQSTISFLPVIDLGIFHNFIMWTRKALQRDTNIATFDEPLWWKEMIIITNEHSS